MPETKPATDAEIAQIRAGLPYKAFLNSPAHQVMTLIARIDAERARADRLEAAPSARPLAEWHEDYGPALWWFFPVCEPPYVGDPRDDDWPGYHTHWTQIVCPADPNEPSNG